MPSNTTYKPTRVSDFEATKLNFAAQGISNTITANHTENLDVTMTDDCLITGLWLIVSNGNYGDHAHLQVIDSTGAFTGTPGTIINQFVTDWYIPTTTSTQFDIAYPAKVYAGMTLRLVYTSTGLLVNPFVAINYKLHKVLI